MGYVSPVDKRAAGSAVSLPRVPDELTELDAAQLVDGEDVDHAVVTGSLDATVIGVLDVSESRLTAMVAHGIEVRDLSLTDVIVEGCDLSGALLRGASMRRVIFRDCRMSGVVLDAATLDDVTFQTCKLDTASLRSIDTTRVSFDDTVLREADLSSARLRGASFRGCDLREARFTKADVRGASIRRSELAGLRGADALRGVSIGEHEVGDLVGALFDALSITVADPTDESSS